MKIPTVNVGCKLPHGTVLELGAAKVVKTAVVYDHIVLQGRLAAKRGAAYGTTAVEAEFWAKWLKMNAKLRYVMDGSIFVVK